MTFYIDVQCSRVKQTTPRLHLRFWWEHILYILAPARPHTHDQSCTRTNIVYIFKAKELIYGMVKLHLDNMRENLIINNYYVAFIDISNRIEIKIFLHYSRAMTSPYREVSGLNWKVSHISKSHIPITGTQKILQDEGTF